MPATLVQPSIDFNQQGAHSSRTPISSFRSQENASKEPSVPIIPIGESFQKLGAKSDIDRIQKQATEDSDLTDYTDDPSRIHVVSLPTVGLKSLLKLGAHPQPGVHRTVQKARKRIKYEDLQVLPDFIPSKQNQIEDFVSMLIQLAQRKLEKFLVYSSKHMENNTLPMIKGTFCDTEIHKK